VFSSIGWVAINTESSEVNVKAYSPDGRGIFIRNSLIPYAYEYRGQRIGGTKRYKMTPLFSKEAEENRAPIPYRKKKRRHNRPRINWENVG